MPLAEHDFRKALVSHINLMDGVLTRLAASIGAAPLGQRDELEATYERFSNVHGVMKADLRRLS